MAPAQLSCEAVRGPAHPVRPIGRATAIQYLKRTPKGLEKYWHPFEPHAQPKLGVDAHGIPAFWAGRYRVLDGGITDRSPRSVRPESLPTNPKSLADLGLLQWIEYDPGGGQRSKTLRAPSRSLLVHDEQGNLYVMPTEETMKKYGKKNPLEIRGHAGQATPGDILMAFVLVGAGEAVATELLSALPPKISGYKRPLIQAALGMGLGYFAAKTESIPNEVALSLGASGAVLGLLGVKNEFMLQRAAGATYRPGGAAALGPGGLPQGYAPISRAQCAVHTR